jgi:hypothetical protein
MTATLPLDLGAMFGASGFADAATSLREGLAESGGGKWALLPTGLLGAKIETAVTAGLGGLDLFGIFAQGWAKSTELAALADPAKTPPGETSYATLGKIEQQLPIELALTVALGPLKSPPMPLVLMLTAKFEAVELAIRDSHIERAGGGHCRLTGQLRYGKHKLSPDQEAASIDLPGEIRFAAPGIAIGAARKPAPPPPPVS